MTRTPAQALTAARTQSRYGPAFGVGECKRRVRELYNVPSDGAGSAAIAWTRTRHRHTFVDQAPPPGALIWWLGGAHDYGHVALYAGDGQVWSTDIKRGGYFDLVPVHTIVTSWPSLRLVGWSEDIDGVRVINTQEEDMPKYTDWPKADREALARDVAAEVILRLRRMKLGRVGTFGPVLQAIFRNTRKPR